MPSVQPAFTWSVSPILEVEADLLFIPVLQPEADTTEGKADDKEDAPHKTPAELGLTAVDEALQGQLNTVLAQEGFDGASGSHVVLRTVAGGAVKAKAVVLVGLGTAKKASPLRLEKALAKAFGAVSSWKGCTTLAVALPAKQEGLGLTQSTIAIVDGVYQALYRTAEAKKPAPTFTTVTLVWAEPACDVLQDALSTGLAMATARSFSKDLVNKPANTKTTLTMVEAAQTLAKLPGVTVTVMDDVAWIEKEMPCFFEVARGSVDSDPPKFITVSYSPVSPAPVVKHLALVGKTVIFDTGGYQVKPDSYMCTMKGDMTGGSMVLGTLQALATLQPNNVSVTAYLAATPNKINSFAMIPDTVVGTTVGKKVEIRHTDAEGRLTLIDAVAKAAEGYNAPAKPEALLTIATLTGSAMRAVGLCVALMANQAAVDTGLNTAVLTAAKRLGEPFQQLDVIDEDYDDIKSKMDGADIINTSQNKNRGAQSAAAFVMTGAPETLPMVHLDIAGADMTGDEKATGIGQKTLIKWVLSASKS
jgi:leucyl aminopeptidase